MRRSYLASLLLLSVVAVAHGVTVADIHSWLTDKSILHPKIAYDYPVGTKLVTTDSISENEFIASFPISSIISLDNALADADLKEHADAFTGRQTSTVVAIYLLVLKARDDPKWSTWISTLPTSFDTPLYFTEAELKELDGSALQNIAVARRQLIDSEWAELEKIFKTLPSLFQSSTFTLENYKWAMSVVFSRSVLMQFQEAVAPAILPLVDAAAQDLRDATLVLNNTEGRVFLTSNKNYTKGEEFSMGKGFRTKGLQLLNYGSLIDDPAIDSVTITLNLDESDPFTDVRKRILTKVGASTSQSFIIGRQGVPLDVLRTLRIHLAQPAELSNWETAMQGPLSLQTELLVVRTLISATDTLLSKYPTTIQEDAGLLSSGDLSRRQHMIVQVRKGEKEILLATKEIMVRHWLSFLEPPAENQNQ
eukprot:GILI01002515.1.p1 GENE.GILI01002515.1~~GILI01002515.1.p1  ORF type:complete len:422 (-),score=142.39 GILI01002515.1:458-1723(-)